MNFSKVISSITSAKSLSLPVAILLKNSSARFYSTNPCHAPDTSVKASRFPIFTSQNSLLSNNKNSRERDLKLLKRVLSLLKVTPAQVLFCKFCLRCLLLKVGSSDIHMVTRICNRSKMLSTTPSKFTFYFSCTTSNAKSNRLLQKMLKLISVVL